MMFPRLERIENLIDKAKIINEVVMNLINTLSNMIDEKTDKDLLQLLTLKKKTLLSKIEKYEDILVHVDMAIDSCIDDSQLNDAEKGYVNGEEAYIDIVLKRKVV